MSNFVTNCEICYIAISIICIFDYASNRFFPKDFLSIFKDAS